jgi:hypothetical protein
VNNKIQQRFDASIRRAISEARAADVSNPRRDLTARIKAIPTERALGKGRLYLDKVTGATVFEPASQSAKGDEHGR